MRDQGDPTSGSGRATRTIAAELPFAVHDRKAALWHRGCWPLRWLRLPGTMPGSAAYRLRLDIAVATTWRIRVSAGERYRLWLDGVESGCGPERGDARRWRMDAYTIDLQPGPHWLAIQVWALGPEGPVWQDAIPPGLLVIGEDEAHEQVSTGHGDWRVRPLCGHAWMPQPPGFYTGPRLHLDATRQPWGWQHGQGDGFEPALTAALAPNPATRGVQRNPPLLVCASLRPPPRRPLPSGRVVFVDAPPLASADEDTPACKPERDLADEHVRWQQAIDGRRPFEILPGEARRCLVDLGEYRCCWPGLRAGGAGGRIDLRFAESLFADPAGPVDGAAKGDRRRWEGRYLRGVGPSFTTDVQTRELSTLEWECGRWLEIAVHAGHEPVRLEGLRLIEEAHDFADEAGFACDDPRVQAVRDLCVRTMRMGNYDHYCDSPYFERLQYLGDTRVSVLSTWCMTADDALPRRALEDFAGARLPDGLLPSRHPARGVQVIPPFSLLWIGMLHDRAWWRGDLAALRSLLPVARGILDTWLLHRAGDGLLHAPPGWNFVDWVDGHGWRAGVPPGGEGGCSTVLNWQMVWALRQEAALEELVGDPAIAAVQRDRAAGIVDALEVCFDPVRGRYRDEPGSDAASEHAQILAVLAGVDPARQERLADALCSCPDLARASLYFTHYLFEVHGMLGRGDLLWSRLGSWFDLLDLGLTTTPEQPDPARSDCHHWGAHPLYHLAATLAGIRPAAPGFAAVSVQPIRGTPLRRLALSVPHPRGRIRVDLHRAGEAWHGTVEVPAGVPATLAPGLERIPSTEVPTSGAETR